MFMQKRERNVFCEGAKLALHFLFIDIYPLFYIMLCIDGFSFFNFYLMKWFEFCIIKYNYYFMLGDNKVGATKRKIKYTQHVHQV